MAKALAHAKRSRATLLVAKLDRLGRNVAFLSALMEAKVDFVAVDNPAANKLTLHILAAVAEAEAEAIAPLPDQSGVIQAYKARGGKLGGSLEQCRNLTPEARERGARKRRPTCGGPRPTAAYCGPVRADRPRVARQGTDASGNCR